jgi:hypothetical protein
MVVHSRIGRTHNDHPRLKIVNLFFQVPKEISASSLEALLNEWVGVAHVMTPFFSDVEQSGLWLSHIANLYSGGQVGERDIEQAMRAFPEFLNTVFGSKGVLPQQRCRSAMASTIPMSKRSFLMLFWFLKMGLSPSATLRQLLSKEKAS